MAIESSPGHVGIPHAARRRVAAMAATILVHAVLLLIILSGRGTQTVVSPVTTALTVFDVSLPPPPAPLPVPPPPVRERPHPDAGGSPGRARTLPRAAMAQAPTPSVRAAMLVEEPPLVSPQGRPISADLLALPDIAVGNGGGAERGGAGGSGNGRGSGTGSGDGVGLARALWIRMPTVPEMEPYWPVRARRERIAGRVILACIVPRPGPPRRCSVIHEHPQGIGFGSSAVKMSRLFRMKPVTRGSAVEDLPVIVPVRFDVPIDIKLPAKAS
ncbi:TonB family protein [Sphingomonas mollis]|uniref:TonB family protein n=1 Tax=Sphingomonas mollis TaxID=2795726 RepID=A0ABS0XPP4_9SPHN|nr:TonB family protein [Sphingomonas sp. BT553]MBJ6122003.1 TonB family protein [Sphingomonas sp. BT553]